MKGYLQSKGIIIEGEPKLLLFAEKGTCEEALKELKGLQDKAITRQLENYDPMFVNRMKVELNDIFSIQNQFRIY